MNIVRNQVDRTKLNGKVELPFELRLEDFALALQDVYDFFFDVNLELVAKGLERLDDMLRPAIMSGVLSDMLTASLAKHSRTLTENEHFNGHPDLVVRGVYPGNAVASGTEGVEIKTTKKPGGAVDTHGAREKLDLQTEQVIAAAILERGQFWDRDRCHREVPRVFLNPDA